MLSVDLQSWHGFKSIQELVCNSFFQLTTLTLNESPSFARRFFELITRYKIDLIASCGNFGMPEMFKQHAIDFPSDPLPKYFRVSFSGYGFGASVCSENDEGENNEGGDGFFDECNYVVLDVTKDATLFYYKKRPSGKILESGTIYKNTVIHFYSSD